MNEVVAIVPAAGSGSRIGGSAKQFRALAGRPVLAHTLAALTADTRITGIVVVVGSGPQPARDMVAGVACPLVFADGGARRADSVRAGLVEAGRCFPRATHVAVHDAVRPCLHPQDLAAVLDAGLRTRHGAILARTPTDTVKQGGETVRATLDRDCLWLAQTPQVFERRILLAALDRCLDDASLVSDEAAAMERAGYTPYLVPSRHPNPKITWPEDLMLAERLIGGQGADE